MILILSGMSTVIMFLLFLIRERMNPPVFILMPTIYIGLTMIWDMKKERRC